VIVLLVLLSTGEQAILAFTGNILGAIFSFIIYLFTEIQLFGINMMMVLFLMLAFFSVM
jgi:hypothetical protein